MDINGKLIQKINRKGVNSCGIFDSDESFKIRTKRVVKYIEISTNGNDGFYIDEWKLTKDNKRILNQGSDDGKGWCLSTDSNDGKGNWKTYLVNGCKGKLRFLTYE